DERRSDWVYLTDVDDESVCLDLGCGWGAVAVGLAERCGQVYAMDATWERLRMLVLRKEQEHIDNLHPVYGGTNLSFPFRRDSFDLISLVGVLEWIPQWKKDMHPWACHIHALKKLHGHLKDNGSIYIAIENRTGYNYIMGRKDHNGVRFVSLMPRPLADVVSRISTGSGYRTYQYTFMGYRKLLKLAGFTDIRFYITVPNYRDPYVYLPMDSPEAARYFIDELFDTFTLISPERKKEYAVEYAAAKAALKVGSIFPLWRLLKWITPGFSIIARKK
ncbi:MAG TPA: class I SAM-dependent methyltransferase, partial [bacterium]|nr:class I SAM-dependent methyltransferase [bacterium]